MKTKTILITSIVALGMLVIVGVLSWQLGKQASASHLPSQQPPQASIVLEATTNREEDESSVAVLPGLHECLTTVDGLRRKVVTTQPNLRCLDKINGGRLHSVELSLFQELFVLETVPSSGPPEWYLVSSSPRRAHELGYLRADTVAEWNTRLGLRPIAPVLFYSDASDAEQLASTGQTSGEPIGRAAPDDDRKFLPWPIVDSHTVTNDKGQVVEIALLNFLGERQAGDDFGDPAVTVARYSDERKQAIAGEISVITLGFAVDNTQSTDPFVPQIVNFISETSATVSEQRPKLKLALTLYRDDVPGLTWNGSVTKTLWNGVPQPIDDFLSEVRPIKAPTVGSKDYPECAFQGLIEVLNATQWERLSHKVVCWIGDNSAHPEGSDKNANVGPDDIIRLAKEKGITIHAVAIRGSGGDSEQATHLSQCRTIAEATGGKVYSLDDAEQLATEISNAVRREHAIVRKNSEDLQKIADGELTVADYMTTKDRDELRRRYQFVRLLDSAGIELAGFAPGTPKFAQGWAPTQLPGSGAPLFERLVFVSRVEVDLLLSELNNLVALMRTDSTKGVFDTFNVGLGARVGDQSFFSKSREGDLPFDAFMAARGIPLRTGITMKSRTELLAMPPEEKLLLKARLVNEVIPRLTNVRSSTAFRLTGDFDFGWILESCLP